MLRQGQAFPRNVIRHDKDAGTTVRPAGRAVRPGRRVMRPTGRTVRLRRPGARPAGRDARPGGRTTRPVGRTVRPAGRTVRPAGRTVSLGLVTVREPGRQRHGALGEPCSPPSLAGTAENLAGPRFQTFPGAGPEECFPAPDGHRPGPA
jgi:hypothetical protein